MGLSQPVYTGLSQPVYTGIVTTTCTRGLSHFGPFYFILTQWLLANQCHFSLLWLVNHLSFLPCYLRFFVRLHHLPKSLVHTPAANSVAGIEKRNDLKTVGRFSAWLLLLWKHPSLPHQSGEGVNESCPMEDTMCALCTADSWGSEDHDSVSISIRLVKYGVHHFFFLV